MEVYSAEGNINGPIKPTPVGLPEYNDIIEAAVYNQMKLGYKNSGNGELSLDMLRNFFIENNIILAGGFLLSVIHNYVRKNYSSDNIYDLDMDFYVPCKNLVNANKIFAKLVNARRVGQYNATFYCQSFLRRNGIRTVQSFYHYPDNNNQNVIDVMAVRNGRSPLDVVQNFDLTFCQIWYDGKTVWATHPNDVKTKTGTLQGDYVRMLIEGNNSFLRRRISKYRRRGFIIKYDIDVIKNLNVISYNPTALYSRCERIYKDEDYYKRWVSRYLLHVLLYGRYQIGDGYKSVEYHALNQDKRTGMGDANVIHNLNKPLESMPNINISDGYDSDEYDITVPEKYYPNLNRMALNIPEEIREAWLAQDDKTKFYKSLNYILNTFYSQYKLLPPHIRYIEEVRVLGKYKEYEKNKGILFFIEGTNLKEYKNALKNYVARVGMDAITLEDNIPVYDLHLHTLDEAIGVEGLQEHLNTFKNLPDKTKLPCYLSGCNQVLTLDEIRSIVDANYFLDFITPINVILPPDPLLGESGLGDFDPDGNEIKAELGAVLRNRSFSTDGWGNIYHYVMCPFCLGYISRQAGCTYVTHANPDNLSDKLGPFCKNTNLVKEMFDKYEVYHDRLEVCIECGRPCTHHKHLDINNPSHILPMPRTPEGNPDYSRCAGGGRREAIARIIGVRNTMRENPGMEPIALRKVAAFAAEAAATNEAILAQADILLAKEPRDRVNTNLNGPGVGGRRIGKICSHGYETYRQKIPQTRKHKKKEKSKRNTLRNRTQ